MYRQMDFSWVCLATATWTRAAGIRQEIGPGRTWVLLASGVIALAIASQGCGFKPSPPSVIENAPVMDMDQSHRSIVYDVPGKFQTQHGYACADSGNYGYFKIQDKAAIPDNDDATIIFNGWIVKFGDGDHQVQALAPGGILNVETVEASPGRRELHWDAGGLIQGEAFSRPFSWCYFYTLVFWHPDANGLSAMSANDPGEAGYFSDPVGTTGPVHYITGLMTVTEPNPYGGPRAVLPRGYGAWYDDEHNVLQAGFDLSIGIPSISGNTISWNSATLLKDNGVEPFSSSELVALLLGQSVSMWQPPEVLHRIVSSRRRPYWAQETVNFKLTARDGNGCLTCGYVTSPKTVWDDYVVEVPFTYAVPMLTGWDLGDPFSDHHVLEMGAYIDHFSFVPNSNGRSGWLYYTVVSTYSDDGSSAGNETSNEVTVLGFKPVDTTVAGQLNPITPVIKQ